ncbi:unnamed protein product [Paramecium pentaurelia]|uniref:Transmembrane protein n=1 Tax=Paramecium pentaurelia TaxID=43138 RepID=A0A8S1UBI7_9CILI|nr:unnamed protein product [Paramecium pentaurelia]
MIRIIFVSIDFSQCIFYFLLFILQSIFSCYLFLYSLLFQIDNILKFIESSIQCIFYLRITIEQLRKTRELDWNLDKIIRQYQQCKILIQICLFQQQLFVTQQFIMRILNMRLVLCLGKSITNRFNIFFMMIVFINEQQQVYFYEKNLKFTLNQNLYVATTLNHFILHVNREQDVIIYNYFKLNGLVIFYNFGLSFMDFLNESRIYCLQIIQVF